MLMSYAGVPLGYPDRVTREHLLSFNLTRTLGSRLQRGIRSPGVEHLPGPTWHPEPPPRLDCLRWPLGAHRHATLHTLTADPARIADLRAATGTQPLKLSDGATTLTAPMHLLPPLPVSDELWLLSFVDARYFWWDRSPKPEDLDAGNWSSLIQSLLTAVVTSVPIPAIDAVYGTPDKSRWERPHQPVPVLLDAALRAVGFALVSELAGTHRLVTAADAKATEASRIGSGLSGVVAGGVIAEADLKRALPATVRVVFDAPLGSEDVAIAGGVSGAVGRVFAEGNPASRTSYATAAAAAWQILRGGRVEATLAGVVDWVPTGLEDAIEWASDPADGTETNPFGRVTTRVGRPPWGDWNQYRDPPRAEAVRASATDSGRVPAKTLSLNEAATAWVPADADDCWLVPFVGRTVTSGVDYVVADGRRDFEGKPVYGAKDYLTGVTCAGSNVVGTVS